MDTNEELRLAFRNAIDGMMTRAHDIALAVAEEMHETGQIADLPAPQTIMECGIWSLQRALESGEHPFICAAATYATEDYEVGMGPEENWQVANGFSESRVCVRALEATLTGADEDFDEERATKAIVADKANTNTLAIPLAAQLLARGALAAVDADREMQGRPPGDRSDPMHSIKHSFYAVISLAIDILGKQGVDCSFQFIDLRSDPEGGDGAD